MKKSDRLKTIVDLNADQEKKALEELGLIQKKQLHAQEQLDNLTQYRKEYQQKYDNYCLNGARAGQLMEFRSFIDKLDQAIKGQEMTVKKLDDDVNNSRNLWLGLHNRTQSLQKICDKAMAAELKHQDKLEQLELDDRVSSGRRNAQNGMRNAKN